MQQILIQKIKGKIILLKLNINNKTHFQILFQDIKSISISAEHRQYNIQIIKQYKIPNTQISMISYSQQFDPDIEIKHSQLISHMNNKNKVTQQFIKLLKQLCDFQYFYSKNLDKLANSISKLIAGKDPLKEILIIFQRMLACRSQQAQHLAMSIKDDMIPFITNGVSNAQKQSQLKNLAKPNKQLKTQMTRKILSLQRHQASYKKAHQAPKNVKYESINNVNQIGQGTQDAYTQSYNQFTNAIHSYNHTVTKYMQAYSNMCQLFTTIQTDRISCINNAMSKFMIYEMNNIKSVQYGIVRYMKNLEQCQGKFFIQEVVTQIQNTNIMKLAKISVENYIAGMNQQKQQFNISNNPHVEFFTFLKKSFKMPQKITRKQFHTVVMWSFALLDIALKQCQMTFVKELVLNYSQGLFLEIVSSQKYGNEQVCVKIPLLDALISHQVFRNVPIWEKYTNRIIQSAKVEMHTISKDQKQLALKYIQSDLRYLNLIHREDIVSQVHHSITQYIDKIDKKGLNNSTQHRTKNTEYQIHSQSLKGSKRSEQKINIQQTKSTKTRTKGIFSNIDKNNRNKLSQQQIAALDL